MKRLAELDAGNPNIVRESTNIEECGMMPMPGMGGQHTPASINMTADSGSELTGMLRDIMHLAGVHQVHEPEAVAIDMAPAALTAEPVGAIGGMEDPMASAGDKMRSVLDKLNPEPAGDEGGELAAFQGGDEEGEEEPTFGNGGEDGEPEDDEEETDEGQYDNSPADAEPTQSFNANEFAHQENQPGSGNTSSGQERQRNLPTATYETLMKEYKSFIGESEDDTETDEDVEEGFMDTVKKVGSKVFDKLGGGNDEDLIKDLQKKAGVPQTGKKPEPANESMADILKLSGLSK